MSFHINDVQLSAFPSLEDVDSALTAFGLSSAKIRQVLEDFVCRVPMRDNYGYQQSLAGELERHLGSELTRDGSLAFANSSYSRRLNEKADLTLERHGQAQRIFFEVEFRPNVEKDLVKFKIGHNNGRLGVGVLILALDRTVINRGYTTMPEYAKFAAGDSRTEARLPTAPVWHQRSVRRMMSRDVSSNADPGIACQRVRTSLVPLAPLLIANTRPHNF